MNPPRREYREQRLLVNGARLQICKADTAARREIMKLRLPAAGWILILIACLCGARDGAAGQALPQGTRAEIDKVFAEFGEASLEHGTPITTRTVFDIGSTSKQFTAFAILLLERDGKLSLDDDIRKYVPELQPMPRPVTVRHLMLHTSGLRDYLTL
jgi:hypothetical protein